MARYRYCGDVARSFPELGLDLEPGQEFELPGELPENVSTNHPDLEPLERPLLKEE